jgi:hypothetical protein
MTRAMLFPLAVVLGFAGACKVKNLDHCYWQDKPAEYCAEYGLICLADTCGKLELSNKQGCYSANTILAAQDKYDVQCEVFSVNPWPPVDDT